MKTLVALSTVALVAITSVPPAYAKGCIKGAVVGGIAGHVAHHHGLMGAIAGCIVGRHEANRREQIQKNQGNDDQSQ